LGLKTAHIPNIDDDPDFGTREEDRPDIDLDSDIEEGAEAMRRAETAMLAFINRQIRGREHQHQQHQQSALRGIPEALYVKVKDHQDQRTLEERQLLLSRGDVIGKALAYPDSPTGSRKQDCRGKGIPNSLNALREGLP
jgi:hypothetical protein